MGLKKTCNIFWIFLYLSKSLLEASTSRNSNSVFYQRDAPSLYQFVGTSLKRELWENFWWDGAEEIDLRLPFQEMTSEDQLFNETCFWSDQCNSYLSIISPPDMTNIPPPPLPPFLSGFEGILRDSDPRWEDFEIKDDGPPSKNAEEVRSLNWEFKWMDVVTEEECALCRWATGGNQTLFMLPVLRDESGGVSESTAGMLFGVALVSAVLGAAIMGVLLRCRKKRNERNENEQELPGLVQAWKNLRKRHTCQNAPEEASASTNIPIKEAVPPCKASRPGLTMKLWRRNNPQVKMNPSTSPPENSYSEEPYINADANSALYAELSTPVTETSKHQIPNTYSEIPDPVCADKENACSRLCAAAQKVSYENGAYSTSEGPSDQNESSAGSTSTPSSAYYSDASALEFQNSKRRKKKRKGNERLNTCKFSSPSVVNTNLPTSVPVICGHVPFHPVRLNVGAVQTQYIPVQDTLPLRVALLSGHGGFSSRDLELGVPGLLCHAQGVVQNTEEVNNLPATRQVPLQNMRNCCDTNLCNERVISENMCLHGIQNVNNMQRLSNVPTAHGSNPLPENVMVRSYCSETHRPLPPLPSHMFLNGQKALRNPYERNMIDFPSEYV